jgi:hypothetical protein
MPQLRSLYDPPGTSDDELLELKESQKCGADSVEQMSLKLLSGHDPVRNELLSCLESISPGTGGLPEMVTSIPLPAHIGSRMPVLQP